MYDFKCSKCTNIWEELCDFDNKGRYKGVQCPHCGSKRKTRLITGLPVIKFTDPKGTSKMDNTEWAWGYNLEKAQNERRAAEAASHMGTNVHVPIDDLNNGDYFGKVK